MPAASNPLAEQQSSRVCGKSTSSIPLRGWQNRVGPLRFQRSGNPKHLHAFARHCAGIGERLAANAEGSEHRFHDGAGTSQGAASLARVDGNAGTGQHAKKSARCPFHEDRNNSFSVFQRPNGEWTWKCFAGCGGGDAIALLAHVHAISNSEACGSFIEMAGQTSRPQQASERKEKPAKAFHWQVCVAAFTEKHLERLVEWRGLSRAFCLWLQARGLVGLWQGYLAFPVHNRAGVVVAAHYRRKDGSWGYAPLGTKTILS